MPGFLILGLHALNHSKLEHFQNLGDLDTVPHPFLPSAL